MPAHINDNGRPSERPHGTQGRSRRGAWVLTITCVCVFMLMLDMTIVSAALAAIGDEFQASLDGLQWMIDAYGLPLAGLLLTAATFADRVGRKKVFITGLVVFTLASLGLVLSESLIQLNVLRAIQGSGAAMLFGTALPLIAAAFPDRGARVRAVGLYGAVMAAATVAGPVVGGWLVSSLGWRWIFLVNVPIGIAVIVCSIWRLSESSKRGGVRTDWIGSIVLTAGLFCLVFGITRGNSLGWTSVPIYALALASVLLFAVFIIWEINTDHPLLDFTIVKRPRFPGVAIVAFTHTATMMAATNFVMLYFINTLNYSALAAGLRALPMSLSALVSAPIAVQLGRKAPQIALVVSLGLVTLGMWLMSGFDYGCSWTYFVPGMVVAGAGLGAITAVSADLALTFAPEERAGMSTGLLSTIRQMGVVIGVAVLGARFSSVARSTADRDLASLERHLVGNPVPRSDVLRHEFLHALGRGAGVHTARRLPNVYRFLEAPLADIAAMSSTQALNSLFTVSFIVSGAGTVLALIAFALQRVRSDLPQARRRRVPSAISDAARPSVVVGLAAVSESDGAR